MADTTESTEPAEPTAGRTEAPQTEARAARGRGRQAQPAPIDAASSSSSDDDGEQIVKPAGFMVDRVNVQSADGESTIEIPREGITVGKAEAERLVDAAGKGANGRNVLKRRAIG